MFSANIVINDGDFTKTIYSMIKDGHYHEAIKVLHGIPESNTCRAGLSLLGYCYFYVQDFTSAGTYYEQLTQLYPENNDYKLYYAQSLYQACLYDEAFKVSDAIAEVEEYAAQVTKLQAAIRYGQEDLTSAKNLVDACSAEDPDTEVNLGCLLYKDGNYEEALGKFMTCLQNLGFKPYLSYNVALCHYRLKEYGAALKHCATSLSATNKIKKKGNKSIIPYAEYYEIKNGKDGKYGICNECSKRKIATVIKMSNSNTTGLKRHLACKHKHIYNKVFQKEDAQMTLDPMFNALSELVATSLSTVSTATESQEIGNKGTTGYEEHYEIKHGKEGKYGVCNECSKRKISTIIKMSNSNTTGLKRHLASKHKHIYNKMFQKEDSNNSQITLVDPLSFLSNKNTMEKKDFTVLLVEWLTVKHLPLDFFDDDVTQNFFRQVNPAIEVPRTAAMTAALKTVYAQMKPAVFEILQNNKSKISFTVDGWTSIRTKSYHGITAHFIDDYWTLHSLALDFIPCDSKHTALHVANFFYNLQSSCLAGKIQGITMDDVSVNSGFAKSLHEMIVRDNVHFDSARQHFYCFAHVINQAAQDVLKALNLDHSDPENTTLDISDDESDVSDDEDNIEAPLNGPVDKLRIICKKLKKSQGLKMQLSDYCSFFQETLVDFPVEVCTRWNSTHDLILAASKMTKSIDALASNIQDLNRLAISDEEWRTLDAVQKYLKYFKQLSIQLSGDKYPTLPSVIVGLNILIDSIEKLCRKLDDEIIISAFQSGRDKLLNYYQRTNWISCAVLVLDPRHKLDAFERSTWGRELKSQTYDEFLRMFKSQYVDVFGEEQDSVMGDGDGTSDDEFSNSFVSLYKNDGAMNSWEAELNKYFRMGRENFETDILEWWRNHETCLPLLSRMARDLLAIPASSVPVERLFSKEGSILRRNRNALSSDCIEMQLCLNSWFQSSISDVLKKRSF